MSPAGIHSIKELLRRRLDYTAAIGLHAEPGRVRHGLLFRMERDSPYDVQLFFEIVFVDAFLEKFLDVLQLHLTATFEAVRVMNHNVISPLKTNLIPDTVFAALSV